MEWVRDFADEIELNIAIFVFFVCKHLIFIFGTAASADTLNVVSQDVTFAQPILKILHKFEMDDKKMCLVYRLPKRGGGGVVCTGRESIRTRSIHRR